MKKKQLLPLLLLLWTATAPAQHSRERMAGVYYAYPAPQDVKYTAPPEGYKPVYIAHYGRHGSRWLTSDDRYLWVIDHFKDRDNLTKLGRSVAQRLARVWKNAHGNGGQLTPLGAQQHRNIGTRMVERFPEVYQGGAQVTVYSSMRRRCLDSKAAFVAAQQAALAKAGRQAVFTDKTSEADMSWIADDGAEVEALGRRTHPVCREDATRFAAALFRDPSRVADADRLMSELFTIAGDMQDVPLKIDFSDVFTDEECRALYERNNLRMWTIHGLSPANYGVSVRAAEGLWQQIQQLADAALAAGEPAVSLRFGHDTNLYRLLSLIGTTNLSDERVDEMDKVVPMAANLQLVFYSNGKNVLLRLLHNEHEVNIEGIRDQKVYYSWTRVKSHIRKRLEDFHRLRWLEAINTMVGTDRSSLGVTSRYGKGSEERGQMIPAVFEPNGMNFWTPQTQRSERKCVAPYQYADTLFRGFRNSHWLVGGCAQDYGTFTLMPLFGALRHSAEDCATPFDHADEVSHPDYYAVRLPREHLTAEMTGMSHSAFFRFTYDREGTAHIVVAPNSDTGEGFVAIDTARNAIYGYNPVRRIYQGWGEKAGFSGWFVVQFERPIVDCGATDSVAWVSFEVQKGEDLLVKAASSFVDLQGAYNNIAQEMPHWEFCDTRQRTITAWQRRLRQVEVSSADTASVRRFYSALYRTSFLPRAFSDKDGRYPSFAGAREVKKHFLGEIGGKPLYRRAYMDFSLWDTFRALQPLNLLLSSANGGMLQSLVDMYDEGGWLPVFPCWNSYTAAMIGDHATAVLAEAILKDEKSIDVEKAYRAMRKNAFETPKTREEYENGMGRRALTSYLRYGYIPLEDSVKEAFHTREQTSRTLEYAYDDYALAQVAGKLGHTDDYRALMKRAGNWRNVINPATGWADGRYKSGRWLGNRDLTGRVPFLTEGAVCHYSWYVPHDPQGLIRAMGGRERFVSRLDSLFDGGLYWHGNEPCHQIAYLYAYAGEPWKTQQRVRHILQTEYGDTPGGLSGNEDAGQMSAWYVFSAMGFYPVCPVSPYYILSAPAFDRVAIGDFVIEAERRSAEDNYIRRATWNGEPYTRNYITYDMIRQGGTLKFVMGPVPNKEWGSKREDCVPE